jgi:SAM-dependent methyltransferase
MDATSLRLKSDGFDLTVAMTLFINVPDPGQILREMIRVTRPGGLVAAIEPIYQTDGHNEYTPGYTKSERRFMSKLSRRRKSSHAYVEGSNKFIAPQLPNMFSQAGLTDIDTKVFGYAHQRSLSGGDGAQYREVARRRMSMIESGQVTPEAILPRLPTDDIDDASRYIEVTRSQLGRFLRDPKSFENMVFFAAHTMLAVKGKKKR